MNEIKFITTKYDWGYSLWIEVNKKKTLIANKIKSEEEVKELIASLSEKPLEIVPSKKPKKSEEKQMTYQFGDQVEHARRGKGIFLTYGTFQDESVVQFDEDSDAEGETLTVTTHLLKKI